MARKRIGIENTLGNVRDLFSEQGYEVVQIDPHSKSGIELKNCDAYVIAGMDQNLMGITDMEAEAPVINAKGMSPEQVLNQIEQTFRNMEGIQKPNMPS